MLGLCLLGAPFLLAPGPLTGGDRQLNVYIWSNYIAPETVRRFEERHRVRVNVDVYDSNEALIAKMQSGNVDYDVVCPSTYTVQVLVAQGLLRALDFSALPHLANVDPRFLDRPHDPRNRYSVPYFWGTTGIAYRQEPRRDRRLVGRAVGPALPGPDPHARRRARDVRRRPQVARVSASTRPTPGRSRSRSRR